MAKVANRIATAGGTHKRKPRTKKPAQSKPLPPPVEVATAASAPEAAEPKSAGLFAGLGNLLGGTVEATPEAGPETVTYSMPSGGASAGSSPEADGSLSAEAEEILAGIPDCIGGGREADDAGGPADVSGQVGESVPFSAAAGPIDEKTGRALLVQFGSLLSSWREFEEYKAWGLNAGETCGQHLANVANALWVRYAPAFVQSLEGSAPGAMALAFGAGIPLLGVVMADLARAKAVPLVAPQAAPAAAGTQRVNVAAATAPAAPPRPARGIVFEQG